MTAPVDYATLHHPPAPVSGWNPEAQIVQVFAEANGWQYFPLATDQQLPGIVFREPDGASRFAQRAVNIVRIPGRTVTEVGNSFYTEIAAGSQFTQSWGYIALQLDSPVPLLVVQSTRAAQRSALPSLPATASAPLAGDDRLNVYGDDAARAWADHAFDRGMRDRLDDGGFHLEIAPGWLFVYAPHPLAVPDPATWQRVLELVAVLRGIVAAGTGSPVQGAAALPLRSNTAAVNKRRMWWIYGTILVGTLVSFGGAALVWALR